MSSEEQQHLRWVQSSKEQQQEFYMYLGNRKWDLIPKSDMTILTRKVAFGFCGPPTIEFNDSSENENPNANTSSSQLFGYTEEQMESVKEVCKKITELAQVRGVEDDIRFACIFICGRTKTNPENFTIPVFKTLKHEKDGIEEDYFIDTNCRVYAGWADYLKSKQLPPCDYCYPRNGIYSGIEFYGAEDTSNDQSKDGCGGSSDDEDDDDDDDYYFRRQFQVDIEYGVSPSKVVSQTFSFIDKAAEVVDLGATAVLAMGMSPVITLVAPVAAVAAPVAAVAAPVAAVAVPVAAATKVYTAVRCMFNLYNRRTHGQTIGIINSHARKWWLTVAGDALGFAQARKMSSIVRSAELDEGTGVPCRTTFLALRSGVIFAAAASVRLIRSFFEIIERCENNQLTRLDILQFSAQALFFANSLMNLRTAESVIREVQNDIINGHRRDLAGNANRNRMYKFNRRRMQRMVCNANTVQSINNIRSSEEFYSFLIDNSGVNSSLTEVAENFDNEQRLLNKNQQQQNYDPSLDAPEVLVLNTHQSESGSNSGTGSASSSGLDSKSGAGVGSTSGAGLGSSSGTGSVTNCGTCSSSKLGDGLGSSPYYHGVTFFSTSSNLLNSNPTSKVTTRPIRTRPNANGIQQIPISQDMKNLMVINAQNLAIGAISSDEFHSLMRTFYDKLELQNTVKVESSQASSAGSFLRSDENQTTDHDQGHESDITMYSCFKFEDFDPDAFNNSGDLKEYFCIEIASDLLGVPLTDDWGNAEALVIYEESSTFVYFNNDDTLAYGVKIEKIGDINHCYGIATILL